MDRNAIIGILLIAAILLTSTFLFQSPDEEVKEKTTTESVEDIKPEKNEAVIEEAEEEEIVEKTLPGAWDSLAHGVAEEISLENDEIRLKISTKGAQISFAELKNYNAYGGSPLTLVAEGSSRFTYQIPIGANIINTADLYFKPESVSKRSVTLSAELQDGQAIKMSYTLPENGFMSRHQLSLVGMNEVIPRRIQFIDLQWQAKTLQQEKDSTIAANNTTIYYRSVGESPDYLSETEEDEEKLKTETEWVSFKQQFFTQSLISETPFIRADLSSMAATAQHYTKELNAQLTLPYAHQPIQAYDMQLYMGPLKYNVLNKFDAELEKQIPLGWAIFRWINTIIVIPTFNALSSFIGNFGIIILLLTILIKLIVTPFTFKSYLSTAKMKLLRPELEELKKKYGDDMARMQQEQMKLYRTTGVSPFGGCLPLLLQFPFLIAMFRFFPASIELRQENFLWADDLSSYDNILPVFGIERLPFTIPYYGDHVSLFTLLMTVSTIIYTRINSGLTPQQNEYKWISYLMPVFFLGFFNNYAAGLSLYYFYFNILTFGQQYIFRKFIDEDKLRKQIEENKKKPKVIKKSGFQRRLEEMTKQQQQARSRRK